jgi:hypothetical protein
MDPQSSALAKLSIHLNALHDGGSIAESARSNMPRLGSRAWISLLRSMNPGYAPATVTSPMTNVYSWNTCDRRPVIIVLAINLD